MRQDYYRKDTGFEVIDVIQKHCLSFSAGNVVKYLCRAGRKPNSPALKDYNKALAYLDFEIDALDRLRKGLNVRPIEAEGSVYGDISESDLGRLERKIGDAWELSSSIIEAFSLVMKATRLRRTGRYEKSIEALEKAVELILDRIALLEIKVHHG